MNKLSPALIALALVFGGVVLFKTEVPVLNTANLAEVTSATPLPSVTMTTASGNITVTAPSNGQTVGRVFTVTGQARVADNQINYQVRDPQGFKVVTGGVLTDAPDTDSLGNFSFEVKVLDEITGPLVVDVFGNPAEDGTIQDLVRFYLQLE